MKFVLQLQLFWIIRRRFFRQVPNEFRSANLFIRRVLIHLCIILFVLCISYCAGVKTNRRRSKNKIVFFIQRLTHPRDCLCVPNIINITIAIKCLHNFLRLTVQIILIMTVCDRHSARRGRPHNIKSKQ